jgi:hypothetical protein
VPGAELARRPLDEISLFPGMKSGDNPKAIFVWSLSNDICTSFIPNPDLMNSLRIYVKPRTRAEYLFLGFWIIRICYGELAT